MLERRPAAVPPQWWQEWLAGEWGLKLQMPEHCPSTQRAASIGLASSVSVLCSPQGHGSAMLRSMVMSISPQRPPQNSVRAKGSSVSMAHSYRAGDPEIGNHVQPCAGSAFFIHLLPVLPTELSSLGLGKHLG
ncbi:partitioning defective 6-like protein alpha [Platysternon megacephalum]|uniref:Partitioning defective 6-like protein alpha n=1 Tax=Platysternon megacephalum TaxID=55544 RepID=A0A4D9DYM3_9SAUR|nr:partitioning defective 6-like protein alpha [Platysternon megacephalum]